MTPDIFVQAIYFSRSQEIQETSGIRLTQKM